MAPNERGEVGEVVVADVHAVCPDLLKGFLHVDGVPMYDGVEGEAEGAELLFLPLPKRASDLAALAVVDASAEAVTQFGVVELGEDAPPERRVVDGAQDVDGLGDPGAPRDFLQPRTLKDHTFWVTANTCPLWYDAVAPLWRDAFYGCGGQDMPCMTFASYSFSVMMPPSASARPSSSGRSDP